jgi:hypothetical protein
LDQDDPAKMKRLILQKQLNERTFGNAFAALAAIFQNREADLAWPERSKGTKIPA